MAGQPYVQIRQVFESCGVNRVTCVRSLGSLEKQGALSSVVSGRDEFLINKELIAVLSH